jgi:hypothetical protein
LHPSTGRIEGDPDREPLDNFDPIAGRVLRRDQGKGRASAAGKAHDAAMEHCLAAIKVAGQGRGLSGPYPGELTFLEIGVDVDRANRDDRHHRIAGCDTLAHLDLTVGDDAVDGCTDHRAR